MPGETPTVTDQLDRLTSRHLLAFGALVATAESLSLSLGLGLVPCELCWYQRVCTYPLVVVFGVGLRRDRAAVPGTVLPLAVPGTAIAAYHSWLRVASAGGTCTVGGGCSAVQLRVLGLIVIIVGLFRIDRTTSCGRTGKSRQ